MKGQDKHPTLVYDRLMSFLLESEWAHSALETPIPLFRSAHSQPGGLLWIGGVHGDEPEGVELTAHTRDWLCHSSEIKFQWTLIPCLNPDGVTLKQRMNGRHVDLNRNYPSQDWSSESRAPRYFPGPHPGSEPEVKALVALIDKIKPELIVHCHSWHPCIVYSGEPGKPWAEILARHTGYEARSEIGYSTPGSLSSYAWKDRGIPVICIEEQDHIPLAKVWPRFEDGVKELFRQWQKAKS